MFSAKTEAKTNKQTCFSIFWNFAAKRTQVHAWMQQHPKSCWAQSVSNSSGSLLLTSVLGLLVMGVIVATLKLGLIFPNLRVSGGSRLVSDAKLRVVALISYDSISVLHSFVDFHVPLSISVDDIVFGHLHLLPISNDRALLVALRLHTLPAQVLLVALPHRKVVFHLLKHLIHLLDLVVHHIFHFLHHFLSLAKPKEVLFMSAPLLVKQGFRD